MDVGYHMPSRARILAPGCPSATGAGQDASGRRAGRARIRCACSGLMDTRSRADSPAPPAHRDDSAQYCVDDMLDIALVQLGTLRRDALHQLGLDHRLAAPWNNHDRPEAANG